MSTRRNYRGGGSRGGTRTKGNPAHLQNAIKKGVKAGLDAYIGATQKAADKIQSVLPDDMPKLRVQRRRQIKR